MRIEDKLFYTRITLLFVAMFAVIAVADSQRAHEQTRKALTVAIAAIDQATTSQSIAKKAINVANSRSYSYDSDMISGPCEGYTDDDRNAPPARVEKIPISKEEKAMWLESAKEGLHQCHHGNFERAYIMMTAIEYLDDLNKVTPGFTVNELIKYNAQEAYRGIKKGQYLGNAGLLASFAKDFEGPLSKIAPGLTWKKIRWIENHEYENDI